jgi:hypothetical protein
MLSLPPGGRRELAIPAVNLILLSGRSRVGGRPRALFFVFGLELPMAEGWSTSRGMGRSAVAGIAGVALLGAACAGRPPGPTPAPSAAAEPPPAGGIRVSLLWKAPVDLDLYVTDPALETVYFANSPSASGGKLASDVRCSDLQDGKGNHVQSESVVWPTGTPGRYRVGVDFIDRCGNEVSEVGFRVVADPGGKPTEQVGVVAADRFLPVALEFDVVGSGGGESPRAGAPAKEAPR